MIANMANMIAPVLPHASQKIKQMLELPEYKWQEAEISGDYKIQDLRILYNKIDEKEIINDEEEKIEQKNVKKK